MVGSSEENQDSVNKRWMNRYGLAKSAHALYPGKLELICGYSHQQVLGEQFETKFYYFVIICIFFSFYPDYIYVIIVSESWYLFSTSLILDYYCQHLIIMSYS